MDLNRLWKFYETLQDEESRRLFMIKYDLLFNKKYCDFVDTIIKMNYQWEIDFYDDFRAIMGRKRIVIFGAGSDGRMTYDILKKNNIPVYGFCDNDISKQGMKIDGVDIVSLQRVLEENRDSFIIIASQKEAGSMLHQLTDSRFPRENIWYPRLGALYATTGWQYFDCPGLNPLGKEEVFVDAGCYDMSTSKAFVKWSSGQYKRIIAFEPDQYNQAVCLKNMDLENFELLPYAAWSETREGLCFMSAGSGSGVSSKSDTKVHAESIDNVLKGERATFIKMDVEGAEIKAIEGAAYTIKNYKPRLAICVYHRPEDIYNIPLLLMQYREDYKFYIRHYTSCSYETVLYAV